MRKLGIGLGLALLGLTATARASGDYSCTQEWRLGGKGADHDCADRPLLWPGNDTRSNLFMLLRGGQGLAITPKPYDAAQWEARSFGHTFYNWSGLIATFGFEGAAVQRFEGSHCDSLAAGGEAFAAAVGASPALNESERKALLAARGGIGSSCPSAKTGAQPAPEPRLSSVSARHFLAYLAAADSFYSSDWNKARAGFAALTTSRESWVAETAAYMLIRVDLNAAQQAAFDDYGSFKGSQATDRAALARAAKAIATYLARYPNGRYAGSASGFKRRVAWLAGDTAALADAYETALATMPPEGTGADDLLQEIDNKLLWQQGVAPAVHTPLVLAAMDLARMRSDTDGKPATFTAGDLAAQKPYFAAMPELYTYLTATRALSVDGDARAVLAIVPAATPTRGMSPLAYSAQALRGTALAQLHDGATEAHWRALIAAASAPYSKEYAQFGLALWWQGNGHMAQVFAPGSPVVDDTIRQTLLRRLAGPSLLRAQIADKANSAVTRAVAYFTLVHKDLAQGHFADFARDRAMMPDDSPALSYPIPQPDAGSSSVMLFTRGKVQEAYRCPALDITARGLAAQPLDPHARLCLGEFWRIHGFDHLDYFDPLPAADVLGGGKGEFAGATLNRAALYAAVLANRRAPAQDRAYALYRSVMCYAPSGNNDCGGPDVERSQRKAWFNELRQTYPASPWAQNLRYYW